MRPRTFTYPRRALGALIVAFIAVALAAPASASPATCAVCGATIGDRAAVVTDWETNAEHRYHGLSCAVREMHSRFPWSRVAVTSPTGSPITLTRINGAWRAQPEEAVAVRLAASKDECSNILAFAGPDELQAYRSKHRDEMPADAAVTPLASLPAQLLGVATTATTREPIAAAAPIPPATSTPPGRLGESSLPRSVPTRPNELVTRAFFKDVPSDKWAAEFVQKVRDLGLMQGYPDGTFRGDQPVTRYELATILARLAEKEGLSGAVAQPAAASVPAATDPSDRSDASDRSDHSAASDAAGHPSASLRAGGGPALQSRAQATGTASLLGLTGLLAIPDAQVRPAGSFVGTIGSADGKFLGAAGAGIGGGIEAAATTGIIGGMNRQYLGAKLRLDRLSRPGLEIAAGATGLGDSTSVFAAATREFKVGNRSADVTLGVGTGGVLDGIFAGAALPVSDRLQVFAESADLGAGRNFNYGLGYAFNRDLGIKFGQVDDHFAAGLQVGRGF